MKLLAFSSLGFTKGNIPLGLLSITRLEVQSMCYPNLDLLNIMPFVGLPNLHHIHLHGFIGESSLHEPISTLWEEDQESLIISDDPKKNFANIHELSHVKFPRNSPVENLSFEHSQIHGNVLGQIVNSCDKLERLYTTIGTERFNKLCSIEHAMPSLRVHAHCLTELIIMDEGHVDDDDRPVLGSLKEFTCLSHLKIPIFVLLGPPPRVTKSHYARLCANPIDDLLPSSLVILELELCRWFLVHALYAMHLPWAWPTTQLHLPSLTTFQIVHSGSQSLSQIEAALGHLGSFQDLGINFDPHFP